MPGIRDPPIIFYHITRYKMRLTKDEAAILYQALYEQKYALNERIAHFAKDKKIGSFAAFNDLENRLSTFSVDRRRMGRTSQNDFIDILKRFVYRYHKSR